MQRSICSDTNAFLFVFCGRNPAMDNKLLEVKNLQVSIKTYRGEVQAVRDVSFSIEKVKCSVSWESPDAEKV